MKYEDAVQRANELIKKELDIDKVVKLGNFSDEFIKFSTPQGDVIAQWEVETEKYTENLSILQYLKSAKNNKHIPVEKPKSKRRYIGLSTEDIKDSITAYRSLIKTLKSSEEEDKIEEYKIKIEELENELRQR